MPTRRTIEPKSRLASINSKGKVTPKDAEAYVFAVRTTEARQIIDRYINLAQANRPVGVFFTVEDAKEWLAKQPR